VNGDGALQSNEVEGSDLSRWQTRWCMDDDFNYYFRETFGGSRSQSVVRRLPVKRWDGARLRSAHRSPIRDDRSARGRKNTDPHRIRQDRSRVSAPVLGKPLAGNRARPHRIALPARTAVSKRFMVFLEVPVRNL
jgi:hypothetical protein